MSIENKNSPERSLANQETLTDLATICKIRTEAIKDDHIAYSRTSDSTVLLHNNHRPGIIQTNEPVGDYEIWVLKWLEEEHPGYGPHTFTTYKFYLDGDTIHAKRIYEFNESNDDPRENLIENRDNSLPTYLTDEDPEFTLIKQAFEGLPKTSSSLESPEQQMEAVQRFFGGDPEETTLGLHDLSQIEAEEVRKLLFTAEPTRDPYFEL